MREQLGARKIVLIHRQPLLRRRALRLALLWLRVVAVVVLVVVLLCLVLLLLVVVVVVVVLRVASIWRASSSHDWLASVRRQHCSLRTL